MTERDYKTVSRTIAALCEGETDIIAKMATISCELYQALDGFDWVGFYRVVEPGLLKIGPYQGGHGCLVIPFDKGVCGACATSRTTQIVEDVEAFPGHIACSSSTRSEIVLPVFENGNLVAVLDVDSDNPAEFGEHDREALEAILAANF
ncbi:MAG: GAF domain-containing protein [Rhizobiaceae bacterium]|nr:GAF domain-containing protein [Rhizobiaceae bacterium]